MIDSNLIKQFRDKVNANCEFILYKYRNVENKNKWNIICACMDWIEVAVDYLMNNKFDEKNINVKSMQIYTYISSIDIIWEAVQQLHRVIMNTKGIPFKGEKKVFKQNDMNKDDNEYFKHIRAVFGAHPVDLRDEKNNPKWFASWPTTGIYDQYDVSVLLYSREINNKDMVFGIKFNELEEFLNSRYGYLMALMQEIDKQYKKFCEDKVKKNIKSAKDILEQLSILKKECEERLNNDYYRYTIEDLIVIYEAKNTLKENEKLVDEYREKLVDVVEEIKINLQNMNIIDLKTDCMLNPQFPSKIMYQLSKLSECLRGYRYHDSLYSYYIKEIGCFLSGCITINENMDAKEIFLLIKVGLFNYYENNNIS